MKLSIKSTTTNLKKSSLANAKKLRDKWREAASSAPEYYTHNFAHMANGGLKFKTKTVKEQTLRFDCIYAKNK